MSTGARDIVNGLQRMTSNDVPVSTSPTLSFTSGLSAGASVNSRRSRTGSMAVKQLKPFVTGDIHILLLENINTSGQEILREQGYQVEALRGSLPEDELIEKIKYEARRLLLIIAR